MLLSHWPRQRGSWQIISYHHMWCAAIQIQRTCDLVQKQHVSVAPCFGLCCLLTAQAVVQFYLQSRIPIGNAAVPQWISMWYAAIQIQRTCDLVQKQHVSVAPCFGLCCLLTGPGNVVQFYLQSRIPIGNAAVPQWISMWCAAIQIQRTCDLVRQQHVSVAPCFGLCCLLTGPGNVVQFYLQSRIPIGNAAVPQWISMWCAAIHIQGTCDMTGKQHVSVAPCLSRC